MRVSFEISLDEAIIAMMYELGLGSQIASMLSGIGGEITNHETLQKHILTNQTNNGKSICI